MEIDELMRRTDPGLVGLCLDTGHAVFGGADFGSGVWDLTAGNARRGGPLRALTHLLDRLLFAGAAFVCWHGHRRVLRAGGLGFFRYWKTAWQAYRTAARHKKTGTALEVGTEAFQ